AVDRNRSGGFFLRDHIMQRVASGIHREGHAREGRVRHDADERAFEFAYIGADMTRQKEDDIVGNEEIFRFGLVTQNGDTSFELRRLNVRHDPPLKARDEALLERRNLFWRAIARDHDLLTRVVERIKGIEELFLRTFLID